MAGIREMALGITKVLAFGCEPDPLFIDLWNETPEAGGGLYQALEP